MQLRCHPPSEVRMSIEFISCDGMATHSNIQISQEKCNFVKFSENVKHFFTIRPQKASKQPEIRYIMAIMCPFRQKYKIGADSK